jgi:ketosteroid isomerase-like protein
VAIRALFERHRLALEAKNLGAVKQTFDQDGPVVVITGDRGPMTDWPAVEGLYRDWFATVERIEMTDTCVGIRVHSSGTAAWATYLTDEADTTKGKRVVEHLRATFGLEKHGQTWVVVQAHWSVGTGSS